MKSYILKKDLSEWVGKYFEKQDLIAIEDLIAVIEELDAEVENLKEEKEQIIQDRDDNYKSIWG